MAVRCPLLIVCVFMASVLFSVQSGDAKTLVWVTDDTPGGNYIIGGGTSFQQEKPGIEIELYKMVGERLGLDIQFKRLPWKMCLQQIELNQVEGVFPASFKAQRMEIGVYPMKDGNVDSTRKTRDNAYFLYKLKSSQLSWDGQTFSNHTGIIAAPLGWAIVEDLKKMNVNVKEVPIHKASPDLIVLNRVEGFVCLESVFDGYIKRDLQKYQDIIKVLPVIWEKPYYLMLSKSFVEENPALAQKIWDTIFQIKQSEEFEALVDKYLE